MFFHVNGDIVGKFLGWIEGLLTYLNTYPVKACMNFVILLDEIGQGFDSAKLIRIRVLAGNLISAVTLIVIDFANSKSLVSFNFIFICCDRICKS